jgi:hypothetical protein
MTSSGRRAWTSAAATARGWPPPAPAAAPSSPWPTGSWPTTLHQRLALPQVAIAVLFSVRPETINKRIRDIRQLLDQAGYTIQPGLHRLASLDDLYRLATTAEITVPPEIKTAC